MKSTITNFDPEDYNNNIQCEYDFGQNHPIIPVYQQCARCLYTKGKLVPLCATCGFKFNGQKLCNDCYNEMQDGREKEWLNE